MDDEPVGEFVRSVYGASSVVRGGDVRVAEFDRIYDDSQPEAAGGAALQGASGTPGVGPASTA